jgi:hypothetical protein
MGGDDYAPMDTSPPPPPPPSKAQRKRQANSVREANILKNTAAARPAHVAAHMASAGRMRERKLKQAEDTLAQLLADMLGAAPVLLPCSKCKGACVVDDTLFPHTVAARDFCRQNVMLPRHIRCSGCDSRQYLDPLYFGFFSANPVRKVRKEGVSCCRWPLTLASNVSSFILGFRCDFLLADG